MPTSQTTRKIDALTRFRVTRPQWILALAALIALLSIGYTTITESSTTVAQATVLSDVETPAASIIFTQRETLVYATRLAQWSNGGNTRRQVQIARNLLAQRLAVIDGSGRSMGSRATNGYWSALKDSDAIVASAPTGLLPEKLHKSFNDQISPVIDRILLEARNLVVSYQRSIDKEMTANAKHTADADRRVITLFYLFLIFFGLFLVTNVRTNFKSYRRARRIIESEQRRLEETLQQLKETEGTVAKLQDLDQAKNAFISTVNHELRTPLTSIIGYIDVIREEESIVGHNISGYLDVLDRNAQILLNLVESMLSLSKFDASRGRISQERVSVNEVIDNALFVMRPVLEKSQIVVNRSGDLESPCDVRGDAGQLSQVFLNLIGNAAKFSSAGSSIEITTNQIDELDKSFIEISVRDHGIGIPKEDLEHLFERFFRAKNAVSQQYQGTGLGLAIVEQSLALHGATITVDSEVGVGTTFTIRIPAFPTPEEEMIEARRESVLQKAIDRLRAATAGQLQELTHELGGAIGFYGFTEEGEALLQLSRKVSGDFPTSGHAFGEKLDSVIASLEFHLREIRGEAHE